MTAGNVWLVVTRSRKVHPLPFWLLIAAWACANCPSFLAITALSWFNEARSFTHQQRLTLEVASLLTGEKVDGIISKARETAKNLPKPTLPATASLKKVELAMEKTSELLPRALRSEFIGGEDVMIPEAARSAPPDEPPRVGRFA